MEMATQELPAPVEEHDYEALPPNYSFGDNMLAGAFAGIIEHSVIYPLDLLKTRLQIINPSEGGVYTGMSNAFSKMKKAEGMPAMWRGISSVIIGAGPAHAGYFVTYEVVKQALGGNADAKHHPFVAAASGASAVTVGDALMNPFDVVKQRMQMYGSAYRTLGQCARTIYKAEGFAAFYVSYPASICMSVPSAALFVPAYETSSKIINPRGKYDPLTHAVAGGLAGAFAAGVTTPLDVIKTLLQTRGSASDASIRNVRGIADAAAIIKRQHGFKGFFRGARPRILTVMPSSALSWFSYETAKAYFIRRSEDAKPI